MKQKENSEKCYPPTVLKLVDHGVQLLKLVRGVLIGRRATGQEKHTDQADHHVEHDDANDYLEDKTDCASNRSSECGGQDQGEDEQPNDRK